MAFGLDLRERVITAVDRGLHIDEASKLFTVSRRVIYEWLELRKKTNSLAPKTGYQKGHSHTITDWDQFKSFANTYRHCTVKTMIVEWAKLTNVVAAASVMERALKKIGYTYKKKLWIHRG